MPIAADDPLPSILGGEPALARFWPRAEDLRLQILLGWIENGPDGTPTLRQAGFRADAEYFYPASSVKLFGAIAALEQLERLQQPSEGAGAPLTVDTPMTLHPQFEETAVTDSDPTNVVGTPGSAAGKITLRHEIRKLFLVSDNESFNRLYEFTGQDVLHQSMQRAGLTDSRILHRLSEFRSPEENRHTPQIDFGSPALFSLPSRLSQPLETLPPIPGLSIGKGYMSGDEKVEGPMDFTPKNRVSLHDLQRGLCKLVRPGVDCGGGLSWNLTAESRQLLLDAMSQYPRESENPIYDPVQYPDTSGKNLLAGIESVVKRERFRIYNKTGQAYGFSIENAWIEDRATGRGYFVTATIYTNADGVLNDDAYDYAEDAVPFFTALGEATGRWFWKR